MGYRLDDERDHGNPTDSEYSYLDAIEIDDQERPPFMDLRTMEYRDDARDEEAEYDAHIERYDNDAAYRDKMDRIGLFVGRNER